MTYFITLKIEVLTYLVFNCYLFFHFVPIQSECCNFHRNVLVNLLKYMLSLKNNFKLVKSVNLFGEIDTNIYILIDPTTLHRPILAPVQKQCIVKYGSLWVNMIGRQFGFGNMCTVSENDLLKNNDQKWIKSVNPFVEMDTTISNSIYPKIFICFLQFEIWCIVKHGILRVNMFGY